MKSFSRLATLGGMLLYTALPLSSQEVSSLPYQPPQQESGFELPVPAFRHPTESDDDIETLIDAIPSFPEAVVEDHRVDSYIVSDTDQYLIHIRQSHMPNLDDLIERFDNGTEQEQEQIRRQVNNIMAVQYDIIGIYEQLRTHLDISSIYAESFTEEIVQRLPERARLTAEAFSYFTQNQSLQEAHTVLKERHAEYTFDAIIFLYDMGFASVQAAETEEAYRKAGIIFDQTKESPDAEDIRQYIFEDRENALLSLIAQDTSRYALTTYGSMHSWQDNIEGWNESNPDHQISLIEISPDNLQPFLPYLPIDSSGYDN